MNKPSERIVVFVSPAQKRAIAATAEELGISVSELMRRAVLSFGATSEQVKAASIVDRLRAPREPDALNEALRRVARSTRQVRETTHPALKAKPVVPAAEVQVQARAAQTGAVARLAQQDAVRDAQQVAEVPVDPLRALAASASAAATQGVDANADADAQAAAEAAARVAAAKAAALKAKARADADSVGHDDAPCVDPSEGHGRFA
ncbi:MAG TPA: hypothetical protein VNE00_01625 [Paraburkholderia sp.]|jgi:hypothetical protein|nr:hypothetical protein [Paraburkholderia sp.]